jgi:uncharacterized membrane protein
MEVKSTITINRPVSELYAFWHAFENLPRVMRHLESVEVLDARHSHWVAKAPADRTVEWDAEIVEDVPDQRIAWRSVKGSQIPNAGVVRFVATPGGRGTEIHVELSYDPPAGAVGALVAKLFGEEPQQQIDGDLQRFKQIVEAGVVLAPDVSLGGIGSSTLRQPTSQPSANETRP